MSKKKTTRKSSNAGLHDAKINKKDEFYTQYSDIQNEVNAYIDYNPDVFRDKVILLPCDDPEWSNFTKFFAQNFERFGLKKLISTSYAIESKNVNWDWQPTLFETSDPQYDVKKTKCKGKIFTLERTSSSDRIDINNLKWRYLEGTGDFQSDEVKKLRDEADIIVTNPPFSLFREFVDWIMKGNKKCLIIGNLNCITYKEIFPLLKENKLWVGKRFNQRVNGKNMMFEVPDEYPDTGTEIIRDASGKRYISVSGTGWFTNLEHGKRHKPLRLMTKDDNIRYSKHPEIQGRGYCKYDNYDAIEVPYTDAIPIDYEGMMGVPVSFFNKYCPEQFDIIGLGCGWNGNSPLITKRYSNEQKQVSQTGRAKNVTKLNDGTPAIEIDAPPAKGSYYIVDGKKYLRTYARILIKVKK